MRQGEVSEGTPGLEVDLTYFIGRQLMLRILEGMRREMKWGGRAEGENPQVTGHRMLRIAC